MTSTDLLDVELARPGTWRLSSGERTFTAADLKDAADFFRDSGAARIPIGFGHSDPRFDGSPGFGWLTNVNYAEDEHGPLLRGDLVDLADWVAAAAPRRWPNRSIEGYAGLSYQGRTYRLVLRRLALLGDQPAGMPVLRSLADLRAAVATTDPAAEPIAAGVGDLDYYNLEGDDAMADEYDNEDTVDEEYDEDEDELAQYSTADRVRWALGLAADADADDVLAELLAGGFVPAPVPVAAAARPAGPWGAADPIRWAIDSERISASAEPWYRDRYRDDPARLEAELARYQVVPGLRWLEADLERLTRPRTGAALVAASADDVLGREVARLSRPVPGQPTPVAAAGWDELDDEIARLSRPGQRSPSPVAAAYMPPRTIATGPRPVAYSSFAEEIRAERPELIGSAERAGPLPPLFPGSGALPRETVSGIDPDSLAGLPWRAKLVAACTPSRSAAVEMLTAYGGEDGEALSRLELGRHPAVERHVSDVWAALTQLTRPKTEYGD